jgi:rare lipoprotein A
MNRSGGLLLLLLVLTSGWGCRYPVTPRTDAEPGFELPSDTDVEVSLVTGALTAVASWYGHPYHGRRTSNGEIYDMDLLTAAHRTWPFHTLVRVTHLGNGRSVLVRINDRGPFVEGREIDLSRAAANRLGMLDEGTARVQLEILKDGEAASPPVVVSRPVAGPIAGPVRFRLQMGAFASEKNARRLLDKLQAAIDWLPFKLAEGGDFFRVLSETCLLEAEGEQTRRRLLGLGFEAVLRPCEPGEGG